MKNIIVVAVLASILPLSAGAASYKCTTTALTFEGDRSRTVKGSELGVMVVQKDGIQGSMLGQETIENGIFKLEISIASFDALGIETIKLNFHRKLWNGKTVLTRIEGGFSSGIMAGEIPVETMIGDKSVHAIQFMCHKEKKP